MALVKIDGDGYWRVYSKGTHPKPKRNFFPEKFDTRRQARHFCRHREFMDGLTIVSPDGNCQPYTKAMSEKLKALGMRDR